MGTQRVYKRIARLYDLLDLPFEYGRYRPIRRALFEGVGGKVLDAGVGTGRNMIYYPDDSGVTGIDLSPAMLKRAVRRRDRLGKTVDLCEMDVMATDFADDCFDHVVATFLFCVLDDHYQAPALRELARICKPGGCIHILEYAYSANPRKAFIMRLWAPWVKLMYGATFDRETERYVPEAGLDLVETRFLFQDIIKLIVLTPRQPEIRPDLR
jgi:ubiquinone/menaquinone biosynthesis C-methylase UbiE